MKLNKILGMALLMIGMSSCDQLLDVKLPENQISAGQVFESVQTANSALSGLYAGLWDNSPISGGQTGTILGLHTDDLDFYAFTSTSGNLEIYQNKLTEDNSVVLTYWTNAYQKIYQANAILEGSANSAAIGQEDKNRIKGEALLIRSVLYLYLEQIYGSVPFITTTDYQVNRTMSRTLSADVLKYLEEDLKTSVTLLSDDYRNVERIFPNKKVAELVLAKVRLLQQRYEECEGGLKNIVQSPLYQFQTDVTKVFQKTGRHILWQLKPRLSNDATKEVITYYFANAAPLNYALTSDLVNSFATTDLRRVHWIAPISVGGNTWYRPDKYKNMIDNATEYSVVFRLEEVWLLLAEALAQQNKIEEALPYVNATRQRAGLSALALPISKETLLDEILTENRKEFFTEMGHRFFDLKRLNRLDVLSAVKPNWTTHHRLFPIPQKELLLNPNLNPQNTGY